MLMYGEKNLTAKKYKVDVVIPDLLKGTVGIILVTQCKGDNTRLRTLPLKTLI